MLSGPNAPLWLLRLKYSDTINSVLSQLRGRGCNTVGLDALGAYALDVPESVPIEAVDEALEQLDPESVAAEFPSGEAQRNDCRNAQLMFRLSHEKPARCDIEADRGKRIIDAYVIALHTERR